MENRFSQGQKITPNEIFKIQHKESANAIDGKTKSLRTTKNKGGVGFGSCEALNEIKKKSSRHPEAPYRKNTLAKEDFNIAEEKISHDHKKGIEGLEAQKSEMNPSYQYMVLPGQVSLCDGGWPPEIEIAGKSDYDFFGGLEPIAVPMSNEFADESSSQYTSPPISPIQFADLSSSPYATPLFRTRWDLANWSPLELKEEARN